MYVVRFVFKAGFRDGSRGVWVVAGNDTEDVAVRGAQATSGSGRSSGPSWGRGWASSNAILSDDKQRPAKQRHTAKRIFDRLKEEHPFTGGYTIVRDYVRSATLRGDEMFVPLTHTPGETQADFGEAVVVIAGEAKLKKHVRREYVQVLRLMETFDLSEVTHAIEDALKLGTISFDAARHIMLCCIERRPPRLDMENCPHLPLAWVHTKQAADYMSLFVEVCA